MTLVFGTVALVQGQSRIPITLAALAENTPEDDETYQLILANAAGGARVDPALGTALLVIPANDDPFGIVNVNAAWIATLANGTRALYVQRLANSARFET